MDRRHFIAGLGAGVGAGVGAGLVAAGSALAPAKAVGMQTAPAASDGASAAHWGEGPLRLKLGYQGGPVSDEHFAFLARYGVTHIAARASTSNDRLYATVEELLATKRLAEKHRLSFAILDPAFLASTHVDRTPHAAIMLADSPEREREVEAFQQQIRNCAEAGVPCIKYNMSILGVLRTGKVEGRGGAMFGAWDAAQAKPPAPLTKAGPVDEDAFWERIGWFLDHVVPVTEEYKIRIACHPHDPGTPPEGYQGVQRVLGTVAGLKRFVSTRESAFHGLNFCQGTVSENLEHPASEIFDVIRWFGTRKKLFNVHFRNIVGGRGHFREAFPDEGDVDLYRALLTYHEVGYDGMLMPDHVPDVPGDPDARWQSFAFAYGHIRGLMQAANEQLRRA